MKSLVPFPVDAEMLVPQRTPLRVVDRLTSFDGNDAVVETVMPEEGVFIRSDGSVEPMVLIELVAQAFASVKGYEDFTEDKPVGKGFLVEVKSCIFFGTAYGGDALRVIIHKTGGTEEFSLADGSVLRGADVLLSGRVMVWIPKEGERS